MQWDETEEGPLVPASGSVIAALIPLEPDISKVIVSPPDVKFVDGRVGRIVHQVPPGIPIRVEKAREIMVSGESRGGTDPDAIRPLRLPPQDVAQPGPGTRGPHGDGVLPRILPLKPQRGEIAIEGGIRSG
jgi:hypothetical protein